MARLRHPNYIYCLICPIDGAIKYVGNTCNMDSRLKAHMRQPCASIKEWITDLKSKGLYPQMKLLQKLERVNSWSIELLWIDKIERKHGGLLNVRGKTSRPRLAS